MPVVPTTTELNVVPDVTVNGYTALFGNTDNGTVNNTWDFSASLSQIHGKHNLHYGLEFFDDQNATSGVPGDPYGTFGFNVGWTQSNPLTATSGQGLGVAGLLLGYPTGGSVDWDSNQLVKYHYYGLFIQDEYKLRKNLTINLGLRWDVNGSPSERHDSMNAGFCLTCPNPYTQQINYKQYPNLVDPLTGGWLFAGAGQPAAPFGVQLNHWQPRFGISWAVTDKWVVRAGYGLFYSFNNTAVDSQGFNQNTSYVASLDGNLTPTNYFLSGHPYPNGVLAPSGSSAGLKPWRARRSAIRAPTASFLTSSAGRLASSERCPKECWWTWNTLQTIPTLSPLAAFGRRVRGAAGRLLREQRLVQCQCCQSVLQRAASGNGFGRIRHRAGLSINAAVPPLQRY